MKVLLFVQRKMPVYREFFLEQKSEVTLPVVVFKQLKQIAPKFPKNIFKNPNVALFARI